MTKLISMTHPVTQADVIRHNWPIETDKSLNLYLGTGRCGGCFDRYGLQHQDDLSPVAKRISRTWLAHADVWHRGRHGLDTQVPLTRLRWSEPPGEPTHYRQHLELAAGRLTTEFAGEDFCYTLTALTNPSEASRDLLFFHFQWKSTKRPALVFSAVPVYPSDYSGELTVQCASSLAGNRAMLDLRRGNSHGLALAHVSGDLCPAISGRDVVIQLGAAKGAGLIILALGSAARKAELQTALDRAVAKTVEQLKAEAEAAWGVRWGKTAFSIGQREHHLLAWRSAYHLLCSYAPDVRCPAPPMGFTGNAWGFHFPQDLSYIHPALLRMGHIDITRAHVEFYHSRLGNQLALTREIYGKPGVCWSWEFPIGPDARLFRPEDGGAPNDFQYEIHNAAYPAKMAAETAASLADPLWTRDIAWPIVRESARFFASGLTAEADGKFSMQISPSMGQDEYGGPNAKNYLCALFAAEYTLSQAVRLARDLRLENDDTARWMKILNAGLAYPRLLLPEFGFYAANESVPFVPRRQKHPVQLNPLWVLPFGRVDEPTRTAYRLRRTVCSTERDNQRHGGVPTGFYEGWTLFAFQLAAARMGDAAGVAHELSEMLPSRVVDPHHIAIYESSGFWQPYYTTSMGLYLQTVLEASTKKLFSL
jgi:hypothetical protein